MLWDNLQNVGELGSLVQVKEGVEMVLGDWVDAQAKRKGLGKVIASNTLPLFEAGGIAEEFDQQRVQQLVLQRKALEEEAQAIQQELLTAIEEVAGTAASDPAERLFAEDTARGLKLLQPLARHFDVVVIIPYGSFVDQEPVRKFVDITYPLPRTTSMRPSSIAPPIWSKTRATWGRWCRPHLQPTRPLRNCAPRFCSHVIHCW